MIKRGLTILGGLCILVGGVWMLQGIGVLPGSFMSGQMQWAYNGAVAVAVGLVVVAAVNWRRKPRV